MVTPVDLPNSAPNRFSINLISIFQESRANSNPRNRNTTSKESRAKHDSRRHRTAISKHLYVKKHLTSDGLIEWSLKHDLSKWERFTWDTLRKLVLDTNSQPRSWPDHIKQHLIVLRNSELSDSEAFAALCAYITQDSGKEHSATNATSDEIRSMDSTKYEPEITPVARDILQRILSPGQYTSVNAKSEHVDDLSSVAIQGAKESVQWRDEVEKNIVYTDTVQMFIPAEPDRDAQLLVTVSMDKAWKILQILGLVETP